MFRCFDQSNGQRGYSVQSDDVRQSFTNNEGVLHIFLLKGDSGLTYILSILVNRL